MGFRRAAFYKPAVEDPDDAHAQLAPLIVQQLVTSTTPAPFGAVSPIGHGRFEVDTTAPTVYGGRCSIVLAGVEHEQTLHVWFYPPGTVCEGDGPCARGVRVTYDSGGFPVIWEVLAARGEPRMIFVSRSIESAVREAVGPPLAGRQHAVEPSLADYPDVVVPRILDDGPVPMGPFVYLDARHQQVTTLICRCMPSQVEDFETNEYYQLRDVDDLISIGFPDGSAAAVSDVWAHWANHPGDADWLGDALRLPVGF